MGFSGIGIWEIVLIFVVIIIVLGPHRLPEIAKTMGKWFRAVKRAGSEISTNITRELEESKDQPSSTDKNTTSKSTPPAKDPPASTGEGLQQKK
ncbi:MAG: Sec-independent protein translocase protein TatB [Dehalococcoidia bacterium]|jgi:Tat protein translocase TatB subunit